MRSRQQQQQHAALAEEEQEQVVAGVRKDAQRLDAWTRRLFAGMNAAACVAVVCCLAKVSNARRGVFGEWSGYAHQAVVLDTIPGAWPWLVAAYAATVVELACAFRICRGGAPRWTGRVALVAASGPPFMWLPALARHHMPLATWWIPLAAPLSLAVSSYVDLDMADLATRVSQLEGLRYDCKSV